MPYKPVLVFATFALSSNNLLCCILALALTSAFSIAPALICMSISAIVSFCATVSVFLVTVKLISLPGSSLVFAISSNGPLMIVEVTALLVLSLTTSPALKSTEFAAGS